MIQCTPNGKARILSWGEQKTLSPRNLRKDEKKYINFVHSSAHLIVGPIWSIWMDHTRVPPLIYIRSMGFTLYTHQNGLDHWIDCAPVLDDWNFWALTLPGWAIYIHSSTVQLSWCMHLTFFIEPKLFVHIMNLADLFWVPEFLFRIDIGEGGGILNYLLHMFFECGRFIMGSRDWWLRQNETGGILHFAF